MIRADSACVAGAYPGGWLKASRNRPRKAAGSALAHDQCFEHAMDVSRLRCPTGDLPRDRSSSSRGPDASWPQQPLQMVVIRVQLLQVPSVLRLHAVLLCLPDIELRLIEAMLSPRLRHRHASLDLRNEPYDPCPDVSTLALSILTG